MTERLTADERAVITQWAEGCVTGDVSDPWAARLILELRDELNDENWRADQALASLDAALARVKALTAELARLTPTADIFGNPLASPDGTTEGE